MGAYTLIQTTFFCVAVLLTCLNIRDRFFTKRVGGWRSSKRSTKTFTTDFRQLRYERALGDGGVSRLSHFLCYAWLWRLTERVVRDLRGVQPVQGGGERGEWHHSHHLGHWGPLHSGLASVFTIKLLNLNVESLKTVCLLGRSTKGGILLITQLKMEVLSFYLLTSRLRSLLSITGLSSMSF